MKNITRQTRIKAALKGFSHNITQPPSSYKILISREPVQFQMMAMTALGYLIAWGPFAALCMWEMVTKPRVSGETSLTSPLVAWKLLLWWEKSMSKYTHDLLSTDYKCFRTFQRPIGWWPACLPSLPLPTIPSSTSSCSRASEETPWLCLKGSHLAWDQSWMWTTWLERVLFSDYVGTMTLISPTTAPILGKTISSKLTVHIHSIRESVWMALWNPAFKSTEFLFLLNQRLN